MGKLSGKLYILPLTSFQSIPALHLLSVCLLCLPHLAPQPAAGPVRTPS